MDVSVKKDKKGKCWYVSHKRIGFTEGIFLTMDELIELKNQLEDVVP